MTKSQTGENALTKDLRTPIYESIAVKFASLLYVVILAISFRRDEASLTLVTNEIRSF